MSIYIYAFLGPNLQDLQRRVLKAFAALGFRVEIHPEMQLLSPNPTGSLYMAVLATPPSVKRLAPHVPLLVRFRYDVAPPRTGNSRNSLRPFRMIREFSYEVCTSTGSGRPRSNYFMQALTAAILARETEGYFYLNGDVEAVPGSAGLERILAELDGLNAAGKHLKTFLKDLQGKAGEDSQGALKAMEHRLNVEFDLNALPFESWPPVDPAARFEWPTPISAPSPT